MRNSLSLALLSFTVFLGEWYFLGENFILKLLFFFGLERLPVVVMVADRSLIVKVQILVQIKVCVHQGKSKSNELG